MKQTPAAILVLASAILGQTAAVRAYEPTGVIFGLVAAAVGIWGLLALFTSCLRRRELLVDNHARLDVFDKLFRDEPVAAAPLPETADRTGGPRLHTPDYELSPEVKAQLSLVAHMKGQHRNEILNDVLRRHLPRYRTTQAAA